MATEQVAVQSGQIGYKPTSRGINTSNTRHTLHHTPHIPLSDVRRAQKGPRATTPEKGESVAGLPQKPLAACSSTYQTALFEYTTHITHHFTFDKRVGGKG